MTIENRNLNIPNISVTALVERLAALYSGAVENGIPFSDLPTPFLWGPTGIGKSSGVKQLAELLGKLTGKTVNVIDVRLFMFTPSDLRGIPVKDEKKGPDDELRFTVWLLPKIFLMDTSDNVINIIFLDELSAAPQSVQAAAYQITEDRRIGEHILPSNCIVIAAGNRTTDQSVSFKMPKALANRLMHFNVQSDMDSWKKWAYENGIDSRIIGFLEFENSMFCVTPASSDLAFPSPRIWMYVSNVLKALDSPKDLRSCHDLLSGCVGIDTAVAFESWCGFCDSLPSVDDIIRGTCRVYPPTQDALYALTSSIVSAVHERREHIGPDELDNICSYASRFPSDFAMSLFKDLNAMDDIRLTLMKCPSMKDWLSRNMKRL